MEEKINVTASGGATELTILKGEAKPNFKVRNPVKVTGNITVPFDHLNKPTITEIDFQLQKEINLASPNTLQESFLEVNRDLMQINFVEHAGLPYESSYKGVLKLDKDFQGFGINDPSITYKPITLAEKIKMNRSFFESKSEAMKLVSDLKNFEAKIEKEVEAKADDRANKRTLMAQVVTTNIPEGFKMKLPIFKGTAATVFEVEIAIDPMDLSCRLVSPEVNDIVNTIKNELIDDQVNLIKEKHPTLRIFEV